MLAYRYIEDFNLILIPLDYFEIVLWILLCGVLGMISYLFIKESKKNKMFIYPALFFILNIGARIIRLIAKFSIGHPYGFKDFEGIQLILCIIYLLCTYLALFFYYIYLEKDLLKPTHHFFSIMVIIVIVLSFFNYLIPIMFFILIIPFLIAVLGVPGCYLYIAKISTEKKRVHALLMMIGLLLFIFGISFDAPTTAYFWKNVPSMEEFAQFSSPLLQIFGAIIFRYAFYLEKK